MASSLKPLVSLTFLLGFFGAMYGCNSKKNSGDQLVNLASLKRTDNITVVSGSYSDLQSKVLNLFQQQCYSCHGENGSNSGNIGDVRNLDSLAAKGLVKLGSAATDSKLYLRMTNKAQPMPPKGILGNSDLSLVKTFLEAKPEIRNLVDYASVYQAIEKDFNGLPEADKVNTRYFHLVNKYNSGAPEQSLEQTRKGLSKMLNMLSTSEKILTPLAIDELKLVYRVNLKDYELDRPETMYTHMLKTVYPKMTAEMREKWMPDPAEAVVGNFYGARFKEIFEGKGTSAPFVQPDLHTFKDGLPLVKNEILARMSKRMSEAAQASSAESDAKFGTISTEEASNSKRCQTEASPSGVSCSKPIPLMRADWFVSQVAGNMRMRIYYHGSGMDDDTVTLDAALGIDDVEGSIYDNDPTFDRQSIPKEKRIMRAGFNNSGVSINHRSFERIALEYVPGKPLWRAFEFKDKLKEQYKKHDLFKYAAGPVFEIGNEEEPGFECINFMTNRWTKIEDGRTVRTLSLLDHGAFYPSVMVNNGEPAVVKELKKIRSSEAQAVPSANAKYDELIKSFEDMFGHRDYFRWKSNDYIARNGNLPLVGGDGPYKNIKRIQCELDSSNPVAYRHETLEYLFLKRNGLQAFVNVGLKAEHLDYKIPNQRALENKEAMLIPAHDKSDLLVVGAPLSCLSCHTQGYIEKEDQVAKYVAEAVRPDSVSEDFWKRLKAKIADFHVPFEDLKTQMGKDNTVFRTALQEAGVNYKDPEPIVDTYRNWAIPGMTFSQVAAELEVSEKTLKQTMLYDKEIGDILREFTVPNATIRRAEFEKSYRKLMCKLHESCKEIEFQNIIPNQ